MALKHIDSNPSQRKNQRPHHHSQLKTFDQDANNLNRLEEAMRFTEGRSITLEEGKMVTHLSPSDQKEFTRVMNIADDLRKNVFTP
jgi:hypothetical protein